MLAPTAFKETSFIPESLVILPDLKCAIFSLIFMSFLILVMPFSFPVKSNPTHLSKPTSVLFLKPSLYFLAYTDSANYEILQFRIHSLVLYVYFWSLPNISSSVLVSQPDYQFLKAIICATQKISEVLCMEKGILFSSANL